MSAVREWKITHWEICQLWQMLEWLESSGPAWYAEQAEMLREDLEGSFEEVLLDWQPYVMHIEEQPVSG